MTYFLPTRDEARKIIDVSEAFYVTECEVQGFKVEMYCYRLASYSDFAENRAFELRGLTFVLNPGTGEWERHLTLDKFFNINQNADWMYDDVADKKIASVADKRDGSMITFVRLPNGEVVAKTKMSFVSEQAVMAQKVYDTTEWLRGFVDYLADWNQVPIFELTSPHNQVVLNYASTELVLLQVRYGDTGDYMNMAQLFKQWSGIRQAYNMPGEYRSLDRLLKLKETEENIEGYVVTFEDGQMAKIKTEWYLQLHGLITEGTRENLLIQTILEDNIDDVLAQLTNVSEKRTFIVDVAEKVTHHFNHHVTLIKSKLDEYGGARKEYALANKQYEYFPVLMRLVGRDVDEKAIEETLKNNVLKKINSLSKAQNFLKEINERRYSNG